MKKAVFSLILSMLTLCVSAQITLEVRADVAVDSIFFSNITQDKEYQFIPYSPYRYIKMNGPINDLYNITFYGSTGKRMNQLWLNGTNVTIKGTFTGRKLEVDTVIGSDLYYKSLDFRNRYDQLKESKADSLAINTFLLNEIKENIGNVFSVEIGQTFFYRNMSRKPELTKLYTLLLHQDVGIRNHLFSPYRKIENILSRDKIDFSTFQFYTPEGKLEELTLSPEKKYLIDMWFVGCAPCIEQHKEILKKLEMLKHDNIEVIGISVDQQQQQWADFLTAKKYPWKNLREVDDYTKKLRTDMLIDSYPTYFLLDGSGKISYRANAFTEILKYLQPETAP
ncbi:MAG: TlpA family protein disulfide reductase [Cyclobacteriaceae bacterium]|nr:TlpA family protein disulfide reductase [Cyclobacteriaceae bacterium]